ncbi:MAG: MCP four helix bundle domain-containing protein, partial [Deltaproteobacteria bacterium]|nr:MCP four helix bundle domain-containing protein [Deltaproteobacteria bacterium]
MISMDRLFRGLSISNKLAAVFVLLLLMMGIGGMVGLYNARQLAKITERLYLDSFKRGEVMQSVENEFLSARQEMFLHTIIADATSKSFLDVSIGEHRVKIERLLLEFKDMGIAEGQGVLYGSLVENMDAYWRIHQKVEEMAKKGHRDAALSIIRMEGNKSFTSTVEAIRKL